MFRAIASRAAKSEETYHLSLAKGEELSVMVEDKLSVHTCGQVEITELRNSSANTCPQSEEVDCPIHAKGLKKRQATSKGRRRIAKKKRMQSNQGDAFVLPKINLSLVPPWDGSFCASQGQSQPSSAIGNHSIQGVTVYTSQVQSQPALAIGNHSMQGVTVYTPQVQSQRPLAIGNHSIQGVTVYTPQGQSRPPFIMGSNYVGGHGHGVYSSQSRPVSQSQPQPPMGHTSVHHVTYPTYDESNMSQSMPLVYPTQTSFQELLRGTTVQHFPV
ncbi:hypothetical protein ACSBR2_038786 [Camellia fascicularis]